MPPAPALRMPRGATLSYVLLAGLLGLLYLALFVFQARVDITLDLKTPQATFFRVYWADAGQTYSEKRMSYAQIAPGQGRYHFYIGSMGNMERIRIDPLETTGALTLGQFQISQYGYAPIDIVQRSSLSPPRDSSQLETSMVGGGLAVRTMSNDGHFEMALEPARQWRFPLTELAILGALLLGLALLMRAAQPLITDLRFVPWLLLASLILATIMAFTTGLHQHPDEVSHLRAAEYYARHLIQQPLTQPDAADTFSIYGYSRLAKYELYYQLAGYFQALTAFTGLPALQLARIFSLLLLATLTVFSFRRFAFRPFALPLLISAQVWYLYSYANSDAFALTLCLLLAYQAAWRDSSLNRFLGDARPPYFLARLAILGLAFGALLLLKLYYFAFTLFLGLYLLWRIKQGGFPVRKRLWRRIGLLVLVALTVYGARFAMDVHANGWQSKQLLAELQERYAQPAYKQSTPLEEKNPMLLLKQRGHSLGYLLVNARWFEKSFRSAFGVYGFSDYFASANSYEMIRYTALALLAVLILAAVRARESGGASLLLLVATCAGGLLAASIWNSWSDSFQPQGRYLFPLLPMLAVLYFHVREKAPAQLAEWLSMVLFLLGVGSFVFTGMASLGSFPFAP